MSLKKAITLSGLTLLPIFSDLPKEENKYTNLFTQEINLILNEDTSSLKQNNITHVKTQYNDLKDTPLDVNKKQIKGTFGDVFGYSQAEYIMKNYNNFPDSIEFSPKLKYDIENDSLLFPLIFPELLNYFPKELTELKNYEQFNNYNLDQDHLLIISQCENQKIAMGYYNCGKLTLATYVSPGRNKSTIKGQFSLKHDNVFRKSHKYIGSMPYSLHIFGNYFLHQGWSDGRPQSHGCIRVPGLYQKRLYENLPNIKKNSDTIPASIILEGIYEPTLIDIENKKNLENKNSMINKDSVF